MNELIHELAMRDEYKKGFEAGRQSLLGKYATDDNVGMIFANLDRQKREAEIRLYGVLWYLWENEIISQGKAMELAHKPLNDIIVECLKIRNES